jgi:transposase
VPYNFLAYDHDQLFLLPPSIREWLPEKHPAYFMIDAVGEMNLTAICSVYREDGWGGAAHDPQMMVTLLLYAYSLGVRSSRQIERACEENVSFRVITANQVPDHTTIARFRQRHEQALAGLFTQVLGLMGEAGMAKVGVVALDGTKVGSDAALSANRTRKHIEGEVKKMLAEATEVDRQEDLRFGEARGDEPPAELRTRGDRRRRLREAKARLDAEEQAQQQAHQAHLAKREEIEEATGRKLRGRKPKPPTADPEAKANTTDPESRIMKSRQGLIQGYNAQATVNQEQVILAAEVTDEENDVGQLHPMIRVTIESLLAAGLPLTVPEILLADAGYASEENFRASDGDGPDLYVAVRNDKRHPEPGVKMRGPLPKAATARQQMERKVATKPGQALYKLRSQIVEPVFGQIKDGRSVRRFQRRGKAAANSEWKLICATHNLLKLYRRATASAAAAPWARLTGARAVEPAS